LTASDLEWTPSGCILSVDSNTIDCPTGQAHDGSEVWGTKIGSMTAGSDPSCPRNDRGDLCPAAEYDRWRGDQALVPYTADYYFFKAEN
jgi:hypothetical protein